VTDRLEELRHELADIEAVLGDLGPDAPDEQAAPLRRRADKLERDVMKLEAAARAEAGVIEGTAEEADADPADYRPPATELVVPSLPPGDERDHATLVVLDRHDEDQVLAALEERMDKVLLYDFSKGGTNVVDLSWQGVMECVRLLNGTGHARLRIMPETLQVEVETIEAENGRGPEPYYVATVAATDEVTGYTTIGTSTEPRRMKAKGKIVDDVFARTKAVNKAQRNALKMHIPERLRQAVIALHKGHDQRVLDIKHGAGAAAAAQLPPPVQSEQARALEAEIKATWGEIRLLPGWKDRMLPGVYQAKLSRARSSEPDLEAFRDALVSLRDSLKGAA
jgi:hypothetical protein